MRRREKGRQASSASRGLALATCRQGRYGEEGVGSDEGKVDKRAALREDSHLPRVAKGGMVRRAWEVTRVRSTSEQRFERTPWSVTLVGG